MKLGKKLFLVLFTLLVLISLVEYFRVNHNDFKVKSIPVVVAGQHPDLPIYRSLRSRVLQRLKEFHNKYLWEIGIEDLQKMLGQDAWIERTSIQRRLPNQLQIKIFPKKAIAVYVSHKGKAFPIASDGSLLASVQLTQAPDAPMTRQKSLFKDDRLRKKLADLVSSCIPGTSIGSDNIKNIVFKEESGFHLELFYPEVEVVMGHEYFATKVSRVHRVLDYLEYHQLKGRVIDATFSKKVLVRLRKGS